MTETKTNFIKFLGTAGARFVMIKQLRSSGGIWINADGKNIIMDPGPGSIVQCNKSVPRLDPGILDAIILSHKHLDHCCDVNVMIEGMTEGGFKKRGTLFCPADALDKDPVVLNYIRKFPEEIIVLKEKSTYTINGLQFQTSMRHVHTVETYGIKFNVGGKSISFLMDTKYFPELKEFYSTDIIIISVTFYQPRHDIDHLCVEDVKKIITETKPKKAILTHFGTKMLENNPELIAENLSKEFGIEVIAAYDGMELKLAD